jgi:hypothetical protein
MIPNFGVQSTMDEAAANSPAPADTRGTVKTILANVGVVRSEILVFSILAFILLESFALISGQHPDLISNTMRVAGMLMLFLGLAFYTYAYFHLPSSTQERIFTQQSIAEIARTKRAVQVAHGAGG